MSTDFRVVALDRAWFEALFALDDATLRARGIERRIVEETPGTPCRVSLIDAPVGERVLLLPFTHHEVDSPYRASGPIFVREQGETARPAVNEVPGMLTRRLLSVRAYDTHAMLVDADVLDGAELEGRVRQFFANPEVSYLHVHNARPGCFNCRIDRA